MFETLTQLTGINATALILIALWTTPWKLVALWKAAQKKQSWWFVALFLINTLAILEILYIFVFSKMGGKKSNKKKKRR